MELQLRNKAALVTGATAGIGMAIAEELARECAVVTITGRAQDKIQRALDTISNGAKGIVADLRRWRHPSRHEANNAPVSDEKTRHRPSQQSQYFGACR